MISDSDKLARQVISRSGNQYVEVTFPSREWLAGVLLALPVSVPAPPYYWLVFVAVLLILSGSAWAVGRLRMIPLALLLCVLAVQMLGGTLSSIEGTAIPGTAFLGSVSAVLFLAVGMVVGRADQLLRGFEQSALLLAALICSSFIILGAYRHGISLFIIPEYRLWGATWFPDWPNFICAIPLIAAFLRYFRIKSLDIGIAILLLAAFLTTSRTAILGILLFFMTYFVNRKMKLICLGLVASWIVLWAWSSISIPHQILDRLGKTSDREWIIDAVKRTWHESPWVGYGPVSINSILPDIPYHSFHNSMLETFVKSGLFGAVGFGAFLAYGLFYLIKRSYLSTVATRGQLIIFFMFFCVTSMAQNYFKHPHIAVVFSVVIFSSPIFRLRRGAWTRSHSSINP